jgi:hemoglobin-like flavoprotein
MTPAHVKLVQESFKLVAQIADTAADIFYDRLFATAPQVRALFPQDLKDQKKKLMQMIGTAVTNLHQVDKIADAVAKLGARHVKYGVKDEHYDVVGGALLFTLKQGLGAKFTPEVEAAWTETYGLLAGVMKDAAKNGA